MVAPSQVIREVVAQLGSILSEIDVESLEKVERDAIVRLKNQLIDARLEIRDYEFAETRNEQISQAKTAVTRLESLRKSIIFVSESGLLTAVDVAQLTAQIDQLITLL